MARDSAYQAWVEVLPDFSGFNKKANDGIVSGLGSAGSNGASAFGSSFKSGVGQIFTGNFLADAAMSGARAIGEVIGASLRAGVEYSLGAIDLASKLEQSSGAVTAVFKDDAQTVQDFSKTAAKDIGLARTQYLNFATVVGAQFKNLGIPVKDISTRTNDLLTLGADLAAQFGGDTSTAVSALSSLLRGERDPIEQFGVSLKQTDIDAQLAAMGMAGLTGEAEKQATIQATLALLYEQTADAQGTFAREQDTLAGKQQILNALLTDAQTEFGAALLPTALELTTFATEDLLPILTGALDKAGPVLKESLTEAMPEIKELITSAADGLPGAIEGALSALKGINFLIDPENAGGLNDLVTALDFSDQTEHGAAFQEWKNEYLVTYFEITEAGLQWMTAAEHQVWVVENANREGSDRIKEYWKTSTLATLQELDAMAVQWIGVGQHFGDGLAEGLRNSRSTVRDEAALLAGEAIFTVRNVAGIESPSKVMRELGGYMGEGFALGIADGGPDVNSAMAGLVNIPALTAGQAGPSAAGAASGAPEVIQLVLPDGRVLTELQREHDRSLR